MSCSLLTFSQGESLSGSPCFDRFPNELYGLLASGFRKAPFTLADVSLRDFSCDKGGGFFSGRFLAIFSGLSSRVFTIIVNSGDECKLEPRRYRGLRQVGEVHLSIHVGVLYLIV